MFMVQENWTQEGKIYCEIGIMLKFSFTVTNKRTYFHFYHVYPFSSNLGKKNFYIKNFICSFWLRLKEIHLTIWTVTVTYFIPTNTLENRFPTDDYNIQFDFFALNVHRLRVTRLPSVGGCVGRTWTMCVASSSSSVMFPWWRLMMSFSFGRRTLSISVII